MSIQQKNNNQSAQQRVNNCHSIYQNNALTQLKRQIQVYLTKYIQIACPICFKVYDIYNNPPIIICLNQHKCCKQCSLNQNLFSKFKPIQLNTQTITQIQNMHFNKQTLGQNNRKNPLKAQESQPQLKKCYNDNCTQIIIGNNFKKDNQTIFYLTQLNKQNIKNKHNSQKINNQNNKIKIQANDSRTNQQNKNHLNELTTKLIQIKKYDNQLQTQLLYINKYLLPRLKYKQSSITNAKSKLQTQLITLQKQITKIKKHIKQLQQQQNYLQAEQLQQDQIKDLLSMNYSVQLINDLQNKIQSAKTQSIKQENCKIVQYAFGQTKQQIKSNIPKYIPKNIIILPFQTDQILSPQNPHDDKQVQAPLHIYVDIDPQQQQQINQIDMKKDDNVYAYLQDSIGKLLKRTKNLWRFLKIQKEMKQFSQKQFIQIMCQQMKKIQQFSVTQIYKFQGYQTYKDLLNYLIKQYTNKLYTTVNQIMSSTDPITIARMRYFIHLMLKNYQQQIIGQKPSKQVNEYYRYTKISRRQFKTYSVGGFIFFTTLTSCSYQGQPRFSHSPNIHEVRVKYIINTRSDDIINSNGSQFNPYLDITNLSKYNHQKQVLFFPYQIFLIQQIQYYDELKLAQVQLKQVSKKYIIEQIQKPQNELLQSLIGPLSNNNIQKPQQILGVLQQTKNEMKQRIKQFVNKKKSLIDKKNELKQQQLKDKFTELIQYSSKYKLVQIKKKIMKSQSINDITYLNLCNFILQTQNSQLQIKKNIIHALFYQTQNTQSMGQLNLIHIRTITKQITQKTIIRYYYNQLYKVLLSLINLGKNKIKNINNIQTISNILNQLSLYDNLLNLNSAQYIKSNNISFNQLNTFSISFNCQKIKNNNQCFNIIFDLQILNKQLLTKNKKYQQSYFGRILTKQISVIDRLNKQQIKFLLFPKLNIIEIYNSQRLSEQIKDRIKKSINEMNRINGELHRHKLLIINENKQQLFQQEKINKIRTKQKLQMQKKNKNSKDSKVIKNNKLDLQIPLSPRINTKNKTRLKQRIKDNTIQQQKTNHNKITKQKSQQSFNSILIFWYQ